MRKTAFGMLMTVVSGVAMATILMGVDGCGTVGGGGVCTRSCEAINSDVGNLGPSSGDTTIDPFGPELQALQCQAGQLALEAFDCNCEGARQQGTRDAFVAAINIVCDVAGTGGGVAPPGGGQPIPTGCDATSLMSFQDDLLARAGTARDVTACVLGPGGDCFLVGFGDGGLIEGGFSLQQGAMLVHARFNDGNCAVVISPFNPPQPGEILSRFCNADPRCGPFGE